MSGRRTRRDRGHRAGPPSEAGCRLLARLWSGEVVLVRDGGLALVWPDDGSPCPEFGDSDALDGLLADLEARRLVHPPGDGGAGERTYLTHRGKAVLAEFLADRNPGERAVLNRFREWLDLRRRAGVR